MTPDWQELLELYRGDYLAAARAVARRILVTRPSITVDDVRAICPPPEGKDPRVLGALFRHPDFEPTGEYVRSARATCHRRPIQRFRLAEVSHG